MKVVNVQEAKTHLSRLLEEAVGGDDIVIAKAGRPYVRLSPCLPGSAPRTLGGWQGEVWIADDFDEEDERVATLFGGGTAPSTPTKPRRATAKRGERARR